MPIGPCCRKGCSELGTHQVWVELYPATGNYEGSPAQLFFPDLLFCEAHAQELKSQDLFYEHQVASLFQSLNRVTPDFSRTQVKNAVVQGAEVV